MIQTNPLAAVEWSVEIDCRGHSTNLNHFITSVWLKKLSALSPPIFFLIYKHFLWSFPDFSLVWVCMTNLKKNRDSPWRKTKSSHIKHGQMVKGHMNEPWLWTCRNSSIELVSLTEMDWNEKRKFIVSIPHKMMQVGRVWV